MEKQNKKSIFRGNFSFKLLEKLITISRNNFNLARAMPFFIVLLLSVAMVSAGNVTVQAGDFEIDGNMTIGKKITFALGEIIDNIIDGWITITGGLNVTENVSANYFIGDGSLLTGVSGEGGNFTEDLLINSTQPRINFYENDQSANARALSMYVQGGVFYLVNISDDFQTTQTLFSVVKSDKSVNFGGDLGVVGNISDEQGQIGFGAYESKDTNGTIYQAPTDGFIIINPAATGYYDVYAELGDSTPDVIITRGQAYSSYGSGASVTLPVPKGYYWQVVKTYGSDPTAVWWMPNRV